MKTVYYIGQQITNCIRSFTYPLVFTVKRQNIEPLQLTREDDYKRNTYDNKNKCIYELDIYVNVGTGFKVPSEFIIP